MSMTITVVGDEGCPKCGAIPGHKDPELDYPNRPRVAGEDGVWWWRCYNPDCSVEYYNPDTGEVDEQSLTEEQAQELMAKIDKMPIPDCPSLDDLFGGDE